MENRTCYTGSILGWYAIAIIVIIGLMFIAAIRSSDNQAMLGFGFGSIILLMFTLPFASIIALYGISSLK